jgi:hypothetical protein
MTFNPPSSTYHTDTISPQNIPSGGFPMSDTSPENSPKKSILIPPSLSVVCGTRVLLEDAPTQFSWRISEQVLRLSDGENNPLLFEVHIIRAGQSTALSIVWQGDADEIRVVPPHHLQIIGGLG